MDSLGMEVKFIFLNKIFFILFVLKFFKKKFYLKKVDLEKENYFDSYSIKHLQKEKNGLIAVKDEVLTKRQLLEKEVYLLKEKYIRAEKTKLENEIYNNKALSEYEYLNKGLCENNKKTNFLQVK